MGIKSERINKVKELTSSVSGSSARLITNENFKLLSRAIVDIIDELDIDLINNIHINDATLDGTLNTSLGLNVNNGNFTVNAMGQMFAQGGIYTPLAHISRLRLDPDTNPAAIQAGEIRWTGSDFVGWTGSTWESFLNGGGGSSGFFPNGLEIVTVSRDFQSSDAGKRLMLSGTDISVTMPAINPFDIGDYVGIVSDGIDCAFTVENGGDLIYPLKTGDGSTSECVILMNTVLDGDQWLLPISTSFIYDNVDLKKKTALKHLYDNIRTGTGTPQQIPYYDSFSNITSDDYFIRDVDSNLYTNIFAPTRAFAFNSNAEAYFQSVEYGEIGNSIELVFDGVDDINKVVDDWNSANPSNTVNFFDIGFYTGTSIIGPETITLASGGKTGTEIGKLSSFGDLEGSGIYSYDLTNNIANGFITGDFSFFGMGLGTINGYIDMANNITSAVLVTKDMVNINVSDNINHAELFLSETGNHIKCNNNEIFIDSLAVGWSINNNSVYLPTTTPNIGDILLVSTQAGSDTYLDWSNGGISGNTLGKGEIAFGHEVTGAITSSNRLTWNDTHGNFFVGLNNINNFVIDNDYNFIKCSTGDLGSFNVSDTTNDSSSLVVLPTQHYVAMGSISATASLYDNNIALYVENNNKCIRAHGLSKPVQSSVNFTGSGLNDITIISELYFIENNFNNDFTVQVVGENGQRIVVDSNTGILVGDTVVGQTTGTTGVVYSIDVNTITLHDIVGSGFSTTEVITSALWTTSTNSASSIGDLYSITYRGNSAVGVMGATSYGFAGIYIGFNSPIGHTINDQWDWSYTVEYGNFLHFNSLNTGMLQIGDVDNLYDNATVISIKPSTGYIKINGGQIKKITNVISNTYTIKPSDYYIDIQLGIIGTPVDIYLPNGLLEGTEFVISDESGIAQNYPITIHTPANNIYFNITNTDTLVLDTAGASATFHLNFSLNRFIVTSKI